MTLAIFKVCGVLICISCLPCLALLQDIKNNTVLSRCCNESGTNLLHCVNKAVSANSKSLSSSKVALVTYITPDLGYVSYSLTINSAYAEQHSYDFKILTPQTQSEFDRLDQRWNKVMILLNAIGGTKGHSLNGWARDREYVVWMDADLVVVDFEFQFEAIIAAHPDKDILVSEDPYPDEIFSVANTGCVIVRNSQWSRAFLRAWWGTEGERTGVWDQHRFTKLLLQSDTTSPLGNITQHVQLLPADAINTKRPAVEFHAPHNPILHMVGSVTSHRVNVFSKGMRNLCSYHDGHLTSLPSQLGLTRTVLLEVEKSVIGAKGSAARDLLRSLQSLLREEESPSSSPEPGRGWGACTDPVRLGALNSQLQDILKLGNARDGPEQGVVLQCMELLLQAVMRYVACRDPATDHLLNDSERVDLMRHMQWAVDAAFEIALDNSAATVRRVMTELGALLPRLDALAAALYRNPGEPELYSRATPLYYSFKRHDFLASTFDTTRKNAVNRLLHLYDALQAWREMNGLLAGQQLRALDEGVMVLFHIGMAECLHHSASKGARAFKEGLHMLETHWQTEGRSPRMMPAHMKMAMASAYGNLAACTYKVDPASLETIEMYRTRGLAAERGTFDTGDDVLRTLDVSADAVEGYSSFIDEPLSTEQIARKTKKYARRKAKLNGK